MGPTFFIHLVVFGSALAATVSGYGFVLVASPLLLLLLPPAEAVPLSILLGWAVPLILLTRGAWRHVARGYAFRLVAAGLLGIPLGAYLLFTLPPILLRILLGAIVAATATVNLMALAWQRGFGGAAPAQGARGTQSPAGPGEARQRQLGAPGGAQRPPASGAMPLQTLAFGFAGGIMSAAAGLSGPFMTLYLSRFPLDKHHLRATTASTILMLSSVTLALYAASGRIPPDLARTALSLLPALALGMLAGSRLFGALPELRFRQVTLGFAALAGLGTALAALAPALLPHLT